MIGKLIFSTDLGRDQSLQIGPYQIIFLDETEATDSRIQNAIVGSVLLPPYNIMTRLVEPDYPLVALGDEYLAYLHSPEPLSFMVGILALLMKGVSVIIDTMSCEAEFSLIPQTIQRFLVLRYGMYPEFMGQGFLFPVDPMYTDQIFSDLFLFDYCDLDYLQKMHSNHPFNMDVNNKIIIMGCKQGLYNQMTSDGGIVDPFQVIK